MSLLSSIVPRRDRGLKRNIIEGLILGVILTSLSYIVGLQMGWLAEPDWLEVFAVFTSYTCTYLCVMERRWNYPFGMVSTAAYAYLFWQFGLLASSAINIFLMVYLIYGWIRWRADTNTRPVTRMTLGSWGLHLLVAAAGYGVVVFLATQFGGELAWTDSVILAGTILAQFMMDNKKYENWYVWAIVNVFAIYTYATAGLALAAFQFVFFLGNAFYAMYMWNKSMRTTPAAVSPQTAPALT